MMIKSPPPASTNLAERPMPAYCVSSGHGLGNRDEPFTCAGPYDGFAICDLLPKAFQYLFTVG